MGMMPDFLMRDRMFSPDEMREDLDTLVAAVGEIHPDPHLLRLAEPEVVEGVVEKA